MFAALLKKQLLELGSFYTVNRKTGVRRSKGSMIGYGILLLYVLGVFCFLFAEIAILFAEKFLTGENPDPVFYFEIFAILAVFAGTFGAAFTTYSFLFRAKDNDLLLSMPIPPIVLLLSRTVLVFLTGAVYSACAWIPTVVVYYLYAKPGIAGILSPIFAFLLLSLLIAVLSCLLGWVIALLTARMKNKTLFTAFFTLLFVGLYFFVVGRSENILEAVLLHHQEISLGVMRFGFPIYATAKACPGDALWLLIATAVNAALFALLFFLLAKTFIGIATANYGAKKTVYREKRQEARSIENSLLTNEFRRLFGNSAYLLNCIMGAILMLFASVAVLIKGADALVAISAEGDLTEVLSVLLPAALVSAVLLMTGMNADTACSVSLEGKNLWIVRTFPISGEAVLRAKRKMHLFLNLPVALIFLLATGISFGVRVPALLLTLACSAAGIFAITYLHQIINLRHPNLNWTSVAVVVKQGASTGLAVLFTFLLSAFAFGAVFFLGALFSGEAALAIVTLLLAGFAFLLRRWILTHGAERFENL